MAEYIEREAFLADKKWLYCTDCEKRKGKKRGKMVTLYEIGEAPCKSCGIHNMLEEIEMYPAADVVERKTGVWLMDKMTRTCSVCGQMKATHHKDNYCPNCGSYNGGDNDV